MAQPYWSDNKHLSDKKYRTGKKMLYVANVEGNYVVCKAFINPNTKQFYNYDDASYLHGWCEKCDNYTNSSNVGAVKKDMENGFKEFVVIYGKNRTRKRSYYMERQTA